MEVEAAGPGPGSSRVRGRLPAQLRCNPAHLMEKQIFPQLRGLLTCLVAQTRLPLQDAGMRAERAGTGGRLREVDSGGQQRLGRGVRTTAGKDTKGGRGASGRGGGVPATCRFARCAVRGNQADLGIVNMTSSACSEGTRLGLLAHAQFVLPRILDEVLKDVLLVC